MTNKRELTPKYVVKLARKLRVELTHAESILWNKIQRKQLSGYKFRRQYPIHRYILDFYCCSKKLAIEIDGDIHKNRKEYDHDRDNYLLGFGIETLRFTNAEINSKLSQVLSKITGKLESM